MGGGGGQLPPAPPPPPLATLVVSHRSLFCVCIFVYYLFLLDFLYILFLKDNYSLKKKVVKYWQVIYELIGDCSFFSNSDQRNTFIHSTFIIQYQSHHYILFFVS